MAEPRRVRTQVERDADGVAWRQTADTRPGYATWPQTAPGDPSWWRRGHDGQWQPSPPPHVDIDRLRARTDGNPAGLLLGVTEPSPDEDIAAGRTVRFDTVEEMDAALNGLEPPPPPSVDETCAKWCGYCHLGPEPERVEQMHAAVVEAMDTGEPVLLADGSALITPPRRRWWHRLTRRNP